MAWFAHQVPIRDKFLNTKVSRLVAGKNNMEANDGGECEKEDNDEVQRRRQIAFMNGRCVVSSSVVDVNCYVSLSVFVWMLQIGTECGEGACSPCGYGRP